MIFTTLKEKGKEIVGSIKTAKMMLFSLMVGVIPHSLMAQVPSELQSGLENVVSIFEDAPLIRTIANLVLGGIFVKLLLTKDGNSAKMAGIVVVICVVVLLNLSTFTEWLFPA